MWGGERIKNIVIKNVVVKVFETCDFFILSESVDHLLIFSEHIIENYLFAENIDNFVVVNRMSAIEGRCLIEAESFLERKSYSIL